MGSGVGAELDTSSALRLAMRAARQEEGIVGGGREGGGARLEESFVLVLVLGGVLRFVELMRGVRGSIDCVEELADSEGTCAKFFLGLLEYHRRW